MPSANGVTWASCRLRLLNPCVSGGAVCIRCHLLELGLPRRRGCRDPDRTVAQNLDRADAREADYYRHR